jgi:hypothetical protein
MYSTPSVLLSKQQDLKPESKWIKKKNHVVVHYLRELHRTRNPQDIIIEASSELQHQISHDPAYLRQNKFVVV